MSPGWNPVRSIAAHLAKQDKKQVNELVEAICDLSPAERQELLQQFCAVCGGYHGFFLSSCACKKGAA